ncbi:hypothetical protein EJ04DRAFT_512080 [Polyplosphaeria fusca]|uniref:DNA polymerase delta subunit 4 n=1 Tax=Polyplosphaeria fusca TaxID=682080 RepID=A0A9P4V386_9PLEO|nr:hypothetical protein EJ04DRAFT_512080 [Polyplosphaeria fusca]
MPPKRRTSGKTAAKGSQSTLAFHGASNRVTKPGARTDDAKKSLLPSSTSDASPAKVADVVTTDTSDLTTADAAIVEQTDKEQIAQQVSTTPEEEEAREMTPARIRKYWESKEKERTTPRVHQQALSMHEKILREWDMSAQYGPCTGIARLKRWKRAQRLDLNPPLEVLAVLLREEDGPGKYTVQRSHVDEILNVTAEGTA